MQLLHFLTEHIGAALIAALSFSLLVFGFVDQARTMSRYKPWVLQTLGAAFLFLALGIVLFDYDQERNNLAPVQSERGQLVEGGPASSSFSSEYLTLMSNKPTDLQEQQLLKSHVGESIELALNLIAIERIDDALWAQFDVGGGKYTFVFFSPQWEDYLARRKFGERISFRAMVVEEGSRFRFAEAQPI